MVNDTLFITHDWEISVETHFGEWMVADRGKNVTLFSDLDEALLWAIKFHNGEARVRNGRPC